MLLLDQTEASLKQQHPAFKTAVGSCVFGSVCISCFCDVRTVEANSQKYLGRPAFERVELNPGGIETKLLNST